ncbi:MAG: hypothetical protein DRG82_08230 [Deltaproteobacteria bacterium]|nr:MAG: hypothetical protein DRG82_08230 [Deltaproteobacteria bacterium]
MERTSHLLISHITPNHPAIVNGFPIPRRIYGTKKGDGPYSAFHPPLFLVVLYADLTRYRD